MDTQAFIDAYGASRNGANAFYRHPLVRSFQYSDGVQECAEAGCYWLLDVIATECLKPLRNSGEYMGMVEVLVAAEAATLQLTIADDQPPVWTRRVEYTDLPAGRWVFPLADEGERFALILLTEY